MKSLGKHPSLVVLLVLLVILTAREQREYLNTVEHIRVGSLSFSTNGTPVLFAINAYCVKDIGFHLCTYQATCLYGIWAVKITMQNKISKWIVANVMCHYLQWSSCD